MQKNKNKIKETDEKQEDNFKKNTTSKKREIDKERLIHIIINFLTYFIVFFVKDEKSTLLIILAIIPIALIINSFVYGLRARGCDSIYSMISALIFVPFMYLKLDDTFWIYLLMYLGLIMMSNVIGSFLSNLRKRPDGCTDVGCNCKWKL